MITEIEGYFSKGCGRCDRFATPDCSAHRWSLGLGHLRRICRDTGLTETAKWGHPVYMYAGRNIAMFGAFRADFRLSFFNAALMKDPGGVLEKPGPNARHPALIRFTDTSQPAAMEKTIRAYLQEAMGYAQAGLVPEKTEYELDVPEELAEAMDADPELAEAFHALTPGRKRSYVINLNGAKAAATRISRIAKFRQKIIDGKGATER